MSNSPLGSGGVPQKPAIPPLQAALQKFHSAMYRAADSLRRAGDGVEVTCILNVNTTYSDQQLAYVTHCVTEAREALEAIRRAVSLEEADILREIDETPMNGVHEPKEHGPAQEGA